MIFQKKDQFIVFGNIKFNGYVQLNVMYIVPSPLHWNRPWRSKNKKDEGKWVFATNSNDLIHSYIFETYIV